MKRRKLKKKEYGTEAEDNFSTHLLLKNHHTLKLLDSLDGKRIRKEDNKSNHI